MRKSLTRKKALRLLFLITLLFIWGQSALPRAASSMESQTLTKALFGIDTLERLIRKSAHFIEYAVLGSELFFLLPDFLRKLLNESYAGKTGIRYAACLLSGLVIALIDETIQYFPERMPEIRDIWIDLAGVLCGTVLAWGIASLLQSRKNKQARFEK